MRSNRQLRYACDTSLHTYNVSERTRQAEYDTMNHYQAGDITGQEARQQQ
jgi:hypothetical protein